MKSFNYFFNLFLKWFAEHITPNQIRARPITRQVKLWTTPSVRDKNDHLVSLNIKPLPKVSYRQYMAKAKSQGKWGSCVLQGLLTGMETLARKDGRVYTELSERFSYYVGRQKYMDNFPANEGTYPRLMLKMLQKEGTCPEFFCPYDEDRMNDKPFQSAYSFAKFFKLGEYRRCNSLEDIKKEMTVGNGAGVSMKIYNSFMNHTGKLEYTLKSGGYQGLHWMFIVAYDDETQKVLIQNSWGTWWGKRGYFEVSYDDFNSMTYEMWAFNNDR